MLDKALFFGTFKEKNEWQKLDKIKVEIFGELDGYKQAVVLELVEKTSNHEFTAKYYPEYMYKTAKQIEEQKKKHYDYLKSLSYTIMKKDMVDAYLYMLSKCNTWKEIEKIYNQRPYLLEIR